MKIKAICSLLVLFAIVSGTITAVPDAFADQPEVTIDNAPGSSVSGCEDTEEGCFLPSVATVDVGGTVIFSNSDNVSHTFASGLTSDNDAGSVFDTSLLLPGDTYEWSPTEAGEYPYFCTVHPWMVGTIIVQEAGAAMDDDDDGGSDDNNNGCLIATATYGSELAPQVQQLREIRDNTILSTESGTAFMAGFNSFYYSFSPTVADLEREHPIFRQAVQIMLTPMLSSLSLLNHVDIDSEQEMLGYGISLIVLNIGMYVGIPVFGIMKFYQFRKNDNIRNL